MPTEPTAGPLLNWPRLPPANPCEGLAVSNAFLKTWPASIRRKKARSDGHGKVEEVGGEVQGNLKGKDEGDRQERN